jgi:catechol 2,3-dioxygenase-like lactoylglutathione lyase family enzyme
MSTPKSPPIDMALEVVIIPVSDVDRAVRFYGGLRWRLDADIAHGQDFRKLVGPDPQRRSYGSLVSFSDPDGNAWLVQEVTARLPGRENTEVTTFRSATALAGALRRAEAAHGEHEKRTGQKDANWPDWYAQYMLSEQGGVPPPL